MKQQLARKIFYEEVEIDRVEIKIQEINLTIKNFLYCTVELPHVAHRRSVVHRSSRS